MFTPAQDAHLRDLIDDLDEALDLIKSRNGIYAPIQVDPADATNAALHYIGGIIEEATVYLDDLRRNENSRG
jgi:hypothetical protein